MSVGESKRGEREGARREWVIVPVNGQPAFDDEQTAPFDLAFDRVVDGDEETVREKKR